MSSKWIHGETADRQTDPVEQNWLPAIKLLEVPLCSTEVPWSGAAYSDLTTVMEIFQQGILKVVNVILIGYLNGVNLSILHMQPTELSDK